MRAVRRSFSKRWCALSLSAARPAWLSPLRCWETMARCSPIGGSGISSSLICSTLIRKKVEPIDAAVTWLATPSLRKSQFRKAGSSSAPGRTRETSWPIQNCALSGTRAAAPTVAFRLTITSPGRGSRSPSIMRRYSSSVVIFADVRSTSHDCTSRILASGMPSDVKGTVLCLQSMTVAARFSCVELQCAGISPSQGMPESRRGAQGSRPRVTARVMSARRFSANSPNARSFADTSASIRSVSRSK